VRAAVIKGRAPDLGATVMRSIDALVCVLSLGVYASMIPVPFLIMGYRAAPRSDTRKPAQ
jgi:hypothetical protein